MNLYFCVCYPLKEDEIDEDDRDLEDLSNKISELKEEEARELKRKKKRTNKERKKLQDRLNLKMVLRGDEGPKLESDDMFQLKQSTVCVYNKNLTDPEPALPTDVHMWLDNGPLSIATAVSIHLYEVLT